MGKLFRKENGAFGLAAGAEIPCAAGECQQMLGMTFCATNARETSLEPPAGKELLNRAHDHRTQRPRLRLESLFVGADIAVKVSLKQLIESSPLGMPRTILPRGFGNNPERSMLLRTIMGLGCEQTRGGRLRPEAKHGGQQTSCGRQAAIDLIA